VSAEDTLWSVSATTSVNGTYLSSKAAFTVDDHFNGIATVTLTSQISVPVVVCFSTTPIYSTNLTAACPSGGLATFANNTAAQLEVKFARKSFSAFSSTKRLSGRFAQAVEDTPAPTVTLLPGTAYFLAITSGSIQQTVSLNLTGPLCATGTGPSCIEPPPVTVAAPVAFNASASGFTYFQVDTTAFNASVGSVTFSITMPGPAQASVPNTLSLSAQIGTVPTTSSSAPVVGSGSTIQIENPSAFAGSSLYVGVLNSAAAVVNGLSLSATTTVCPDGSYGIGCKPFSAALLSAALGSTFIDTTKASDQTNPLVFYQLDPATVPATANAVRVSVSSKNSLTSDSVFAKFGAPPSVTDYTYRSQGAYVNQLILPVNTAPAALAAGITYNATWYIAVNATGDYVLWSGNNCANGCSASSCICNNAACDNTTSYQLPTTGIDSNGVCQCSDTKKANNYDCSALVETSSPFKTVYIVLIAVGGAIVLAVAIGVPVYCYLQNRKRDYERL